MSSSGKLRGVALVITDVSVVRIATNIRVTIIGALRKTSGVSSNRSMLRRNTVPYDPPKRRSLQ
jgi:hypothetical protein